MSDPDIAFKHDYLMDVAGELSFVKLLRAGLTELQLPRFR